MCDKIYYVVAMLFLSNTSPHANVEKLFVTSRKHQVFTYMELISLSIIPSTCIWNHVFGAKAIMIRNCFRVQYYITQTFHYQLK